MWTLLLGMLPCLADSLTCYARCFLCSRRCGFACRHWYDLKTPFESNHICLLFRSVLLAPWVSFSLTSGLNVSSSETLGRMLVRQTEKKCTEEIKSDQTQSHSVGVESVDGVNRNAGKMDSSLKNSIVCPVQTKDTRDIDQREEVQRQPESLRNVLGHGNRSQVCSLLYSH